MKRLTVLFISIAAIMAGAVAHAAERTLTTAATEYPPFYGSELADKGFMTEIIRAALDRKGYTVEIHFLPWKRALAQTQNGRYDGLFTVWYREDRKEWFVFSDPLPANELVFFKRKETDINSSDLNTLKPHSIGLVRGYAPPPGFEEAGLKTQPANNDEENLRKLHRGRVDLALVDKIVAQHIINTKLPDAAGDLEWIDPPVHVDIQYLVISKQAADHQKTLQDFNIGLAEITQDGTLQSIMAKHGF